MVYFCCQIVSFVKVDCGFDLEKKFSFWLGAKNKAMAAPKCWISINKKDLSFYLGVTVVNENCVFKQLW